MYSKSSIIFVKNMHEGYKEKQTDIENIFHLIANKCNLKIYFEIVIAFFRNWGCCIQYFSTYIYQFLNVYIII